MVTLSANSILDYDIPMYILLYVYLLNPFRYLEYAKREDMVRSQDFFTVVQYIAQNPVGNKLVWDWIRSNWDYLVGRYSTKHQIQSKLIK
jgi:glutamyl aminopeptidase